MCMEKLCAMHCNLNGSACGKRLGMPFLRTGKQPKFQAQCCISMFIPFKPCATHKFWLSKTRISQGLPWHALLFVKC